MSIKFNRHFYSNISFYFWLVLAIWNLYDLVHSTSLIDHIVYGILLAIAIIALLLIMVKKTPY